MSRDVVGRAKGVLSYFTRHRTMANLFMVLMLVAGAYALPNMRAQYFPDTVIERLWVNVSWPGAGAEDVDRAIVQLLEPALLGVEGVEASSSTSREGSARIMLEFEPDWNMVRANDEVSATIEGMQSGLPQDAEDPTISTANFFSRVTDVIITGPVDVDQLAGYADELVGRLFERGVTRTTLRGVAAPETVIEVTSANLIAYDVTLREISNAIAAEIAANPAGDVTGAGARVRTGVEKRSVAQIEAIALRSYADGRKLVVGDVATIRVNGADRNRSYFVGDNPAISIQVNRTAEGSDIRVQAIVEEVAAEMQATLPNGTTVDLIRTRAELISSRISILLTNGTMGLVLVLILLFLFLNARTAFWVAAGIPIAMLGAVALMYAAGLTFNMISLLALIITLGIVVDDAIVVGEHADARARAGEGPYEAAENAAARMALPVFTATVTTVIAFLALTAIPGRFGSLIADIPFTVAVVLIASLAECFLILPHHMAKSLTQGRGVPWYDLPSTYVNRGVDRFREKVFRPAMRGVIRGRYVIFAGCILLLAGSAALFISNEIRWRFINFPERTSISGNFAMAPGATREDSLDMMREMQRATEALAKEYEDRYGTNPVVYVVASIGGNTGRGLAGAENKTPDQLGSIAIELIDRDERTFERPGTYNLFGLLPIPYTERDSYSVFQFVSDLQDNVRRHPLAETVSFRGRRFGPQSDALSVRFSGADAQSLKDAAETLKTRLARFPEVSALEDSMAYDKEELVLELTPKGRALGFTIDALGAVLRNRISGIEAATYPVGPRSASVRVQLPASELTADFLERTQLRNPQGTYVQLADIVSVERTTGFRSVQRENGVAVISVTGDIDSEDPVQASLIQQELETRILPEVAAEHQVLWQLSGQRQDESTFLTNALLGTALALLGIYVALSWVFASWARPMIVMAVIPFGLVGAFFGHWLLNVPVSMFSIVGIIGMIGIIINDSIVLVTQIDRYAENRGLLSAIVDGAADRMRAVFLTTATTVFGLAPLLFEQSNDVQILIPTVISLVFGLGFGMFLVLLVVPALLAMQNDIGVMFKSSRRGLRFREKRVRRISGWAGAAILIWLGATLGNTLVSGELRWWLNFGFPAGEWPLFSAFKVYLLGLVLILITAWVALMRSLGPASGGHVRYSTPTSWGGGRPDRGPVQQLAMAGPAPVAAAGPTPEILPEEPRKRRRSRSQKSGSQGLMSRLSLGGAALASGAAGLISRRKPAETAPEPVADPVAARRLPPMPDPDGTDAFDRPGAAPAETGPNTGPDTSPVDGRLLVEQVTAPDPEPVVAPAPVDPVAPVPAPERPETLAENAPEPLGDLSETPVSPPATVPVVDTGRAVSDSQEEAPQVADVALADPGPAPLTPDSQVPGGSTEDMPEPEQEPTLRSPQWPQAAAGQPVAQPNRLVATPLVADPQPIPELAPAPAAEAEPAPRRGLFSGIASFLVGFRKPKAEPENTITAGEIERMAGQPIAAEFAQAGARAGGQLPPGAMPPPGMPMAPPPPQGTPEKSALGDAIGAILAGETADRSALSQAPQVSNLPRDADVPSLDSPEPPNIVRGAQPGDAVPSMFGRSAAPSPAPVAPGEAADLAASLAPPTQDVTPVSDPEVLPDAAAMAPPAPEPAPVVEQAAPPPPPPAPEVDDADALLDEVDLAEAAPVAPEPAPVPLAPLRERAAPALRAARVLPPERRMVARPPVAPEQQSWVVPPELPQQAPVQAQQVETPPPPPPPAPQPQVTPQPAPEQQSLSERLKSARMLPAAEGAQPVPVSPPPAPPQPPAAPAPAPQQPPAGQAQLSPGMLALAMEMEQELFGGEDAADPEPPAAAPAPAKGDGVAKGEVPVTGAIHLSMRDTYSSFMGPAGDSIKPQGRLADPGRKSD